MTEECDLHWSEAQLAIQRALCARHGAVFTPCQPAQRLGLAPDLTAATRRLHGARIQPSGDACGWYLWSDEEFAEPPEFYVPLRAHTVDRLVPLALPYLALPPGWRFQIRDGQVDVWQDVTLLADRIVAA